MSWCRARAGSLAATVVALLAIAGIAATATASTGRGDREDRASAGAVAAADYRLDQAVAANVGSMRVAAEEFATTLSAECSSVIAGAPRQATGSGEVSGREMGEESRRNEQERDLRQEIDIAARRSMLATDHQAELEFIASVMALRWSTPAVTADVHGALTRYEEKLRRPIPPLCADMKAWAASGYRTLSSSTKALLQEEEAIERREMKLTERHAGFDSISRYTSDRDKVLLKKGAKLVSKSDVALKPLDRVFRGLEATLGFTRLSAEAPSSHSAPAKIFARGKTAAGERYRAVLESEAEEESGSSGSQHRCRLSVTIERSGPDLGACVSAGSHPPSHPSVNCNEGLLTIFAKTLPSVRQVRLTFGDGSQLTTHVVRVPARLGGRRGSAGVYFQVVRGPKPVPVSLAELDARGAVVKVLKLPRIVGCTRHPLTFLPKGVRTLARGTIPGGPRYSVIGEAFHFLGKIRFKLSVSVANQAGGGETLGGTRPGVYESAIWEGCKPHQFAIVYGVLHDAEDTVFARTPDGLVKLHRVAIPAYMHAHGMLVYGALGEVPTALLVRNRAGRTLFSESLSERATRARETCEGESEAPAAS